MALDDIRDPVTDMNRHETAVMNLLRGKELKADHPVTCLNPEEWFVPHKISITDGKVWVSGRQTCWFALHMCIVRQRDPHLVISDESAERIIEYTAQLQQRPQTAQSMLLESERVLEKENKPVDRPAMARRLLDDAERNFNDSQGF